MREYATPTSSSIGNSILGLDIVDAIVHNIEKLRTTQGWDKENQQNIRTVHDIDEGVWIMDGPGICGGQGGVRVIMRGKQSTFEAWVVCPKEERPKEPQKIL